MAFKDKLKKFRKEKGLTQDEFSRITGIGRSAISMYESGKREPDYVTLTKLSLFFGVPIDDLVDKEKLETNFLPVDESTAFGQAVIKAKKQQESEEQSYYHDPEVARRVEELRTQPGRRILFDASKDLSNEDIDFVLQMIEKLKKGK